MNTKELAALLNNREYREEITRDEEAQAKHAGLVVVFGASDDLMEFRGAIHNELDAYEGTAAYLDANGLLVNECEDSECIYFIRLKRKAKNINQIWDKDGYSWVYETDIPHETFDILEDGEKYCRGIVFSLNEV